MEIDNPELCRSDEDGFFILVERTTYAGFVDEDWTLDQLQAHVAQQGRLGRIAAVHLGPHLVDLPVQVIKERTDRISVREVSTVVEVGSEGLHVVDYTELTMAAQFADSGIVESPEANACVRLPQGRYRVTFRQLRDDADVDQEGPEESEEPALEVIFQPALDEVGALAVGIAWFEV